MTSHRFPWKWNLSDLKKPKEDAPTVFSTFACAGGSTMGYKLAGYRTIGCCEIDPRTNEVYKANLKPRYNYVMDLRDFNKLEEYPDELLNLDILDGSPPCSTFSTAGDREDAWGKAKRFAEGQKLQTLDDLFFVFLDTVEKLQPKVFVAENVTGLVKGNAKGYVSEIIKKARSIGYDMQLFKLNAAFMGVPQKRERVFFVGNRMGFSKLRLNFNEDPIKFGEIRTNHGRKMNPGRITDLIKQRKPGDKNLEDTLQRVENKGGLFNHGFSYDDGVSPTITASCSLIRFYDGCYFSAQDIISVSSFPQDYDFLGSSYSKIQFYCGMSVPPVMVANLAHEIKKQWLNQKGLHAY